MPALALVVELKVVAGQKDALMARTLTLRETVKRNELGCLRYDVLTSEEEADKLFLYEVYANRSALETHFSTSYVKHYLEETKAMVAERKLNFCALAHA